MTQYPGRLTTRRLAAAQGGASAAEFAIVFPMFFLLLFGIVEFARLFWSANTLQYAVAQGARYAMTSPGNNGRPTPGGCATWSATTFETAVQTYLQAQLTAYLSSATAGTPVATANCGANPPTVTVTVSATYNFNFMLANLVTMLGAVPIQQQAKVTTPLL